MEQRKHTQSNPAGVASDLEEHSASGQLEAARPLVEQFETTTRHPIRAVEGLSMNDLRRQAGLADDPREKNSP